MARVKRGRKAQPPPPMNVKAFETPPPPPSTLGEHGLACWERLAPYLVEMRWLSPLHLETFESLCDWWDVYQTQKLYLQEDPTRASFVTESGYEQRSPAAVARNEAYTNFIALCARFGLTPDSLQKLTGRPSRGRGGVPAEDTPAGKVAKFAAKKYAKTS